MATIILTAAAIALAPETGGGSLALFAMTTAAGLAGAAIDSYILGALAGTTKMQGPKLQNSSALSSIEGTPILRVFGQGRVSGSIIWSTRFLETAVVTTQSGGKGGGGGGSAQTTTYEYSVSFAVGLCQGVISGIGRVWADGKLLDLTTLTYRLHTGTETQTADPKIVAIEGAAYAPAFRGTAYIVFESMPLKAYGNRIPQLSFEVIAPSTVSTNNPNTFIPGVQIIPGAGEFVYLPEPVSSYTVGTIAKEAFGIKWLSYNAGYTQTVTENATNNQGISNWSLSMNQLQATIPSIQKASLVVAWFGNDLRAGNCTIQPKVETAAKVMSDWNYSWFAGGIYRNNTVAPYVNAGVVSYDANGALLGGTPSDLSVVQALQDIKTRGMRAALYPFILMDIPSTNTLPNPYSNNASGVGQEVFPWRGRITVSPAAGYTGTVDKTATAATQIAAFFGSAVITDFGTWNGVTIPYTGTDGWTYRRFIMHYVKIAIQAGGVDTFFIGSELKTLLSARSNSITFPAVAAMVTLAANVKAAFTAAGYGSTKVTYAADWSEWCNYCPSDGSNDVLFHLDPLWSSTNIDYIAIDNYFPISDWRNTSTELDYQAYSSIYEIAYLQSNIEGGENYSWYYNSLSDRINQIRTNITDSNSPSEPWIFRNKDMRNWWLNYHHDRPAGARNAGTTSWVPQSKPIIFSELGCPAVDKGTNQPNVFVDPKSGESAIPYFSNATRDDNIQKALLTAVLKYWDPASGNNPTSSVYGSNMIKITETTVWCWDARPFPDFPNRTDKWRDAVNYQYGHWLNGRTNQFLLADLLIALCAQVGLVPDVSKIFGTITGYALDRIMSVREAIDPLSTMYFFDAYISGGQLKFRHRGLKPDWTVTDTGLIPLSSDPNNYSLFTVARTQDVELPGMSNITYNDQNADYLPAVVSSRRLIGGSLVTASSQVAIVSDNATMQRACDVTLMDAWLQRELVTCVFPPNYLGIDAADVILLTLNGITQQYRVTDIDYAYERKATLIRTDQALYFSPAVSTSNLIVSSGAQATPTSLNFLETPILHDSQTTYGPFLCVYSNPWQLNSVYESATNANYSLDTTVIKPAIIGFVSGAVPYTTAPENSWDMGTVLTVTLADPTNILTSVDDTTLLGGANLCAIQTNNGGWELVQFAAATLISGSTYHLTRLLRARLGTDIEFFSGIPDQATFIVLTNLTQSTITQALLNVNLNWKWGPSNRTIADSTYNATAYAPKMVGLRPYSPVHLKAVAGPGANDITLSWVRRTRLLEQGDNWDLVDAPLGETIESYDVDIYNGSTVVRTLAGLTSPTVNYTSAMQVANFGSNQTSIKFIVYQNSATYGRGSGRTAIFSSIPGNS